MKGKIVLTAFSVVSILQGIAYIFLAKTISENAFPGLSDFMPPTALHQAIGAFAIGLGVLAFLSRGLTNEGLKKILLGFVITAILIVLVASKHLFIDGLNVPMPVYIIQIVFLLWFAVSYVKS